MCFCNNRQTDNLNSFGLNTISNTNYNGFNCGYNPYRTRWSNNFCTRGPQGPTGPQGPRGINDSAYAEVPTATVASGAIVPLFQTVATNPTTTTITSGSVNLQSGVYLVTYGFGGVPSVENAGISVSLYANGVELPNGEITQTGVEVSASKTILYNAVNPTTLSLYNTTATTETLEYPYISVTRLQ